MNKRCCLYESNRGCRISQCSQCKQLHRNNFRSISDDIDIIEYDQFSPLELNNKKLVEATEHVIVPPSDFYDNHIIGRGLLSQIQERAKARKTSNILVNGDVIPIKAVYELKGDDNRKAAVVIF